MATNDMIDVVDQNGNQLRITRADYSAQVMAAAKQNWTNLQFFRQVAPQMLNEGFIDEALELSERACELSGGHIPDMYWKAAALAESGDLDQAGAMFAEIQEDAAYPADQARAAMGLARVRARQNRPAETEQLLEWAAETDVTNPQYLILLYGFYNETNRADDGLARVKTLVNKNPTRASGWRALMQIAASRGEIDEARSYADKAMDLGPEQEKQSVLAEISWHYGQAGMPEKIVELLAHQVQEVKHPLALMNLAQAFVDTGRQDKALKLLEALDQSVPPELKPMVQAKLAEVRAAAVGPENLAAADSPQQDATVTGPTMVNPDAPADGIIQPPDNKI
jgi:tetratricopeptide (TPR) repeat protein